MAPRPLRRSIKYRLILADETLTRKPANFNFSILIFQFSVAFPRARPPLQPAQPAAPACPSFRSRKILLHRTCPLAIGSYVSAARPALAICIIPVASLEQTRIAAASVDAAKPPSPLQRKHKKNARTASLSADQGSRFHELAQKEKKSGVLDWRGSLRSASRLGRFRFCHLVNATFGKA